jgi:hypothetical protein
MGIGMILTTLASGVLFGVTACGGIGDLQQTMDATGKAPSGSSARLEPSPRLYPSTCAQPAAVQEPVPERKVQPSYDIKQTEQEMDRILADGEVHSITVLFKDEYKIRIRQGQGGVRDSNNRGLIALNDRGNVLTSINSILINYEFKAFIAHLGSDTMTEAELEARESDDEAKAGYEFPNNGSWATMVLANYTPAKAKGLALSLQRLPGVRMADVIDNPTTGNKTDL